MGLADFFHQLIPKRWKDKIDSPSLDETPGFAGGNLGQQISPDRMSGVASSQVLPQDRANRQSQLMITPGRGYEDIPYDPNHPDEGPTQTRRRLELNAINRDPQGDLLTRAAGRADEFGDPTAAQFPVSAATQTPLYGQGYGAEYNKSPLDPGYIRPSLERTDTNVSPSSLPQPVTGQPTGDIPSTVTPRLDVSEAGAAPLMVRSKNGTPQRSGMLGEGDSLDRETAHRDALSQWSPHRKRGVMNTLEGAGRGFLVGGIPGAVAGGVGSIIKPNLTGRLERSTLLNQANENVDRLSTESAQRIARDNAEIRPVLEQAKLDQTAVKAKDQQEYAAVQESLKLHAGIPFDPSDPNDAALISAAKKHHITIPTNYGQIKPNLAPHVPQTFDRKNKDGTVTHMLSDDFGKTWREGPQSAAPDKTDSSGFTNAQIQQNIGELQAAMRHLGPPPPTEIDDVRVSGDKSYIVGKKTNPAYVEWQKRTDDYSKEIQGWRGKLKAGKASSGLTIQGAIDHFKTKNGRAPTDSEIVNMQAALDGMP